jgi:hypothetical protein
VTSSITGSDPAIQVTAGAGALRAANTTLRLNGYNRLSTYSPSWQLPSGFADNATKDQFWAHLNVDAITDLASGVVERN